MSVGMLDLWLVILFYFYQWCLGVTLVVQTSTNGYDQPMHCDGLMMLEKKTTVSFSCLLSIFLLASVAHMKDSFTTFLAAIMDAPNFSYLLSKLEDACIMPNLAWT